MRVQRNEEILGSSDEILTEQGFSTCSMYVTFK